jgi:hypothetical protein
MIYNEGDDLHKMNFGLEFIRTEKLVTRLMDKMFLRNKWGNKE